MARPLPSDDLYPAPPLQLNFGGSPLGVKITTGSATSIKQKVLLTTALTTYTLRTNLCSLSSIHFHHEWPSCWLANAELGTMLCAAPGGGAGTAPICVWRPEGLYAVRHNTHTAVAGGTLRYVRPAVSPLNGTAGACPFQATGA